MDLVINQTIPDLPQGAMLIKDFKDAKGKPFPEKESTEKYYELLDGAEYTGKGPNGDGEQRTLDEHFWDGIVEKELAEGTADLLKRAQNSYEKSHKMKSKELADALSEHLKSLTDLNYKTMLAAALRQSLPGKDITKTWSRPSRRYNLSARGNKIKPNPTVEFFGDTSGSISYTEVNECLSIVSGIFQHGVKEILLNLFHHNLYLKKKKFKKGHQFNRQELQSGGTDLTDVMEAIDKSGSDINIILTDGYYDRPVLPKNIKNKTVFFLIKEGGCLDHKLKDIGKTLSYKVVK